MATIDECKKRVEYLAGKAGYNGYISPADFNLLWSAAEQRYYNALYEEFERTEKISDALSVHMSDPTAMLMDIEGKYAITNAVQHINAITHVYNGKPWPVKRVQAARVAEHLSSAYDAPDMQFPIYVRYATHLRFYPANIANGEIVFLKKLVPAKWAYTLAGTAGRERPVYNASGSVQPLWLDSCINKIVYMVLSDIGVNMNDPALQQFSERKTQTER